MLKRIIAFLGISSTATASAALPDEQAVIVNFSYGDTDMTRLYALEDRLREAIEKEGVGEFDGDEVAVDGSDGTLYMYGPNADRLFAVVKPILELSDFMRGAAITLRYGPPEGGVKEKDVRLAP